MTERYIAALDPGTAWIRLCVAKEDSDGFEILHYGKVPSAGIRFGRVVNQVKAAECIRRALDKAEEELGFKIGAVASVYPRSEIRRASGKSEVSLVSEKKCISDEEIQLLKDTVKNEFSKDLTEGEDIYEAVAQYFNTDELVHCSEEDIKGSCSPTLEGSFHLYCGRESFRRNFDSALESAGLRLERIYFAPLVVGEEILSTSEKDNGVALVEMGAGVTSVSIFHSGVLRHHACFPFAGRSITLDLKNEIGISEQLAENIKLAYGACCPDKLQSLGDKTLLVETDVEEKKVSAKKISEIIDCRIREIYEAVMYIINQSGLAGKLRSGIVLTGGSATIPNAAMLLRDLTGYSVRIGAPRREGDSAGSIPELDEPGSAGVISILKAALADKYAFSSPKKAPEPSYEETVFEPKAPEKPKSKGIRNPFASKTSDLKKKMDDVGDQIGDLFAKLADDESN